MKNLKKFAALALSASMVMGMTLTSMAAEPEVSVDAPIYAFDITNVVVPTTYVVAFNPNGLDVIKNGNTVNDQIVSKNYGIINKSTKDKVITVTLKVEDLNEDKIEFVETAAEVTSAGADDYVVNLTLVPADATPVKVGATPDDANLTTTGADLANVTMTAATSSAKSLVAGENEVDFLLTKADYTGTIDLDSATNNNVAGDFTLNALAASGKGITAFTFGGTMNAKADWTKLTKGIKITAIYSNENAPDGATPETNTGALFVNPNPTFKTGAEVGTIKYRKGSGNDAVKAIKSIKIVYGTNPYDGYNAGSKWKAATDANGLITFDPVYFDPYITKYPKDATIEAVITYETEGGDEKTATVDVRLKGDTAPSFTTGSGVGTINYTSGVGSVALKSIKKIEMKFNTTMYDGYNASSGKWAAATDVNGLITFDSQYFDPYPTKYPGDSTIEALITYEAVDGTEKTATVDVKLR